MCGALSVVIYSRMIRTDMIFKKSWIDPEADPDRVLCPAINSESFSSFIENRSYANSHCDAAVIGRPCCSI